MSVESEVQRITGQKVSGLRPMSGGCVGQVSLAKLADGSAVAVKSGGADAGLSIEGYMLGYLKKHSDLPVPAVIHAEDGLLIMEYLPSGEGISTSAARHAGELVAALHTVTWDRFGFARDTLIGGLHQPNIPEDRWLTFFRDHRLLYMAMEAHKAGRLAAYVVERIEKLAGRLGEWIGESAKPSLIHGDMWTGNVLCRGGRISGFVDPAIYYADPEIELAFTTLFNTFGDAFFDSYREHRPIQPGFFEERLDLYNLYPLLVHVRLFGGSYVGSVERTLLRFGC